MYHGCVLMKKDHDQVICFNTSGQQGALCYNDWLLLALLTDLCCARM